MNVGESVGFKPMVSVVLTTRDRPRFLATALACFRHSTYLNRELIVVDDGDAHPVDAAAVAALDGRLIRVTPGTPLGTKLNCGLQESRGTWCQKMDDDDWYGPGYLDAMIGEVSKHRTDVCRPLVACLMPFLFFDVARWEIRRSLVNNLPGATLVFAREDWQHSPFRPLGQDEDLWFVRDLSRWGSTVLPVRSPGSLDSFLAVRHRGLVKDRGHTWTQQEDGRSLEQYLHQDRPLYRTPEELLPEWALGFYRGLRTELLTST